MEMRTSDWFVLPGEGPGDPRSVKTPPGFWFCDATTPDGLRRRCWFVHRSLLPVLGLDEPDLVPMRLTPLVAPGRDVPLRPYQDAAVRFAASRDGSILALDMGLGKTRTALVAVASNPSSLGVVVAPLVTWQVWSKEIDLVFGPDHPRVLLRGRDLSEWDPGLHWRRPCIYLCNPEILRAWSASWVGSGLDWVVFDEAHLYCNVRSQRSAGAFKLARIAKQRIALTGTPILSHAMDLYGLLQVVTPDAYGSWLSFAEDLGLPKNRWGIDLNAPVPPDRLAAMKPRLDTVLLRHRWIEVMDQVPELRREVIPVSLEGRDRRRLEDLQRDAREALVGLETCPSQLQQVANLIQVTRLRRYVGAAKVDPVMSFLRDIHEPVVVWAWHRDVVALIRAGLERLGRRVVSVSGEMSGPDRDAAISRFQSGEADVFVGTISTGGVGIDLTVSRLTVFAELPWMPHEIAQAEARVFRSTQRQGCITYWAVVERSIEDRILEVLLQKAYNAGLDIVPSGAETQRRRLEAEDLLAALDLALREANDG